MNITKPTVVSTVSISINALNKLSRDHAGNLLETQESLTAFMLSDDKAVTMDRHTYFKPGETVVIPDGYKQLMKVEVDGVTVIAVCADDAVLPEVDSGDLDELCKELYLSMSVDDHKSDIMDMEGFTKERFVAGEIPLAASASARYSHVNRAFINDGLVMGCVLGNMGTSLMEVPDDVLETSVHEDPSIKINWSGSTSYSLDLNDVHCAVSPVTPHLAKLMHLRADIMGDNSLLVL